MSDTTIYDSLINKITGPNELRELNAELQPAGYLPINDNLVKAQEKIDNMLKYYNLRRACCLQIEDPNNKDNYIVKTLRPAPSGNVFSNTPAGNFYRNQNKVDKVISVPKKKCEANYSSSKSVDCQNFYAVYCKNIMQQYKKINGTLDGFTEFRPECGCYMPLPDYVTSKNMSLPKSCVLKSCSKKEGVFIDPVSLNTDCQVVLCNASTNIGSVKGRDVDLDAKILQACGNGTINNTTTTYSGISLTFIPDAITNILDMTVINKLNNIYSNATVVLPYISSISSSICIILIVIVIIVIIYYYATST